MAVFPAVAAVAAVFPVASDWYLRFLCISVKIRLNKALELK